MHNFSVNFTHEIEPNRVKDLLIGAFEGGSNYWYIIEDKVIPIDWPPEKHPSLYDIPLTESCALIISDIEGDPDYSRKRLDLNALRNGLKTMAEQYPKHFANFLQENDDADTSDAFLQCCLFGEIIFG